MKLFNYINLKELFIGIKDKKLPFKTSYNFAKLMKYAEEKTEFYSQELQKIIDEYGDPETQNGDKIKIKKGFETEVENKINELINLEVEDCDVKFELSELENLDFTVLQINSLIPFIKE